MRLAGVAFSCVLAAFVAIAANAVAGANAEPAVDSPEISLSLRGVLGRTIEVGEPLFVAVRVDHPADQPGALELTPASGTWRDATAVELSSGAGGPVIAHARAIPASLEATTVANGEQALAGVWWFSVDDLQALVPGGYAVRAVLRIRESAGWKGESASEPIMLELVARSDHSVRATQRVIALANAALAEGAPQGAVEILDAALRRDPNQISVLATRASVALSLGDLRAAVFCMRRARALAARERGKPSVALHELSAQIDRALADPAMRDTRMSGAELPPGVLEPVREVPPAGTAKVAAEASTPPVRPSQPVASTPPVAPAVAVVPIPANAPAPIVLSTNPVAPLLGTVIGANDLAETKILADAAGQWAASARAGSEYGRTQYSAAQATGAPNVPVAGNSPDAWCPAGKNDGTDWLEVAFAKPARAIEVRIRQNDTAGAITRIEAIEPDGTAHVWWEGSDPNVPATREIVWFAVRVPRTEYLVERVKITLNLAAVPGWKEIDAVQLVGTAN